MNNPNNQTKITIIITVIVFVLGLSGYALWQIIRHSGEVAVTITLLPPDSTLTVDGAPTKAGTVYLTKRTHTLKTSRQYFTTVTKTINFATYDTSQVLYMEPSPDSALAQQYLINHPDVQAQREAAAGAQSSEIQDKLNSNKFTSLLPFSGPGLEYTIDYDTETQANGNLKITIYIEADTDQAKQDALNWIKDQKVDPSKLNIVYQSLPNPPASPGGSEYQ